MLAAWARPSHAAAAHSRRDQGLRRLDRAAADRPAPRAEPGIVHPIPVVAEERLRAPSQSSSFLTPSSRCTSASANSRSNWALNVFAPGSANNTFTPPRLATRTRVPSGDSSAARISSGNCGCSSSHRPISSTIAWIAAADVGLVPIPSQDERSSRRQEFLGADHLPAVNLALHVDGWLAGVVGLQVRLISCDPRGGGVLPQTEVESPGLRVRERRCSRCDGQGALDGECSNR